MNTFDQFASLRRQNDRQKTNYFSLSAKNPSAVIWLYRKIGPVLRKVHSFPMSRTFRGEGGVEITKVMSEDIICTGPESCPVCRLVEHIKTEVVSGRLAVEAKVIRFDASWGPVATPAAVFAGLYNVKNPEIFERCKAAGISPGESFRGRMVAGEKFYTLVVDNDAPGNGLQIARLPSSLGNGIIDAALAAKEAAANPDDGDPFKNPYAFKVTFNDRELPQNKYKAIAMSPGKYKLTPEIDELISGEPPESYHRILQDPNHEKLAMAFEEFITIPLPMRQLFSGMPANQIVIPVSAPQAPIADAAPVRKMMKPSAPMEPCGNCGKLILATAQQCHHCGMTFEYEVPEATPQAPVAQAAPAAQFSDPEDQDDFFDSNSTPF